MEYQIGEFSKISRLSIKTLRYYHTIKLLNPTRIEAETNYRYYDEKSLEHSQIIIKLKTLDFSLTEINEILSNYNDDKEILEIMKKKLIEIDKKLLKYKNMKENINLFIEDNKGEDKMTKNKNILIKDIEDILICSIRFKGNYSDVGKYFGKLYKTCGRFAVGKPFSMYYDEGYTDKNADIEACVQVSKKFNNTTNDIVCKTLKGGKTLYIIHEGSYNNLGDSYKLLYDYKNSSNLELLNPCREIYIKGPGMIFKGNPQKYLTEIQFFLKNNN